MGEVRTLASKERKARKEHHCNFCDGLIEKGETYDWSKNICDGTLYEWKAHKKCSFLCSELWDYAGRPDEGMDEELFQDSLHEFCQEFICHDCGNCGNCDKECQCCNNGLGCCIDKAYNILQTHILHRSERWVWALRPRTAEEQRQVSE